jgi:hypothetical protein
LTKLDLKKELRRYYTAKKRPEVIEIPEGKFMTILGKGDPNGEEYSQALQALYGMNFTLKFDLKTKGLDYTVMHLEGLWWIEEGIFDLNKPAPREKWRWKSMIRVPDFIKLDMMENVRPKVEEKAGKKVNEVKLELFKEGLAAQILHKGPYSEEGPTIQFLHDFIHEQGYRMRGDHHEIYLNDPRRTKPENIKTILRHPIT